MFTHYKGILATPTDCEWTLQISNEFPNVYLVQFRATSWWNYPKKMQEGQRSFSLSFVSFVNVPIGLILSLQDWNRLKKLKLWRRGDFRLNKWIKAGQITTKSWRNGRFLKKLGKRWTSLWTWPQRRYITCSFHLSSTDAPTPQRASMLLVVLGLLVL